MEYGILIAVGEDGTFQIVNEVHSLNEANESAQNYLTYGPKMDWVAPYEFQIHRRGAEGAYVTIEKFNIPSLM